MTERAVVDLKRGRGRYFFRGKRLIQLNISHRMQQFVLPSEALIIFQSCFEWLNYSERSKAGVGNGVHFSTVRSKLAVRRPWGTYETKNNMAYKTASTQPQYQPTEWTDTSDAPVNVKAMTHG